MIDNFLVPYAAKKNKIEEHFIKRLYPYRQEASQMPDSLMGMIIAQYIVHRVFRKGEHIHELLEGYGLKDPFFGRSELSGTGGILVQPVYLL